MTFRLPSDLRYKGPKFPISSSCDLSLDAFQLPPSGTDSAAYLSTSGTQLGRLAAPMH